MSADLVWHGCNRGVLYRYRPHVNTGDETAVCIDRDFQNRWRTLLSVDDLIAATVALVDERLGLKNETYYLYSSDHGYSLGELNLNWDKRNVYRLQFITIGASGCAFWNTTVKT